MTEAEWLAATDPLPMLVGSLIGKVSARKLRLFAVSCCQRYKTMLTDERCTTALTVAERFADGTASYRELAIAASDIRQISEKRKPEEELTIAVYLAAKYRGVGADSDDPPADRLVAVAEEAALYTPERVARYRGLSVDLTGYRDGYHHAGRAERRAQAVLLRDIFGNPFRPSSVDPSWLTSTVAQLAEGIYQDRAFDRMPILADALQDAGCENEQILDHCRGPGPHVRGCWVVDLVLGKE
jgi:hypothetical protein